MTSRQISAETATVSNMTSDPVVDTTKNDVAGFPNARAQAVKVDLVTSDSPGTSSVAQTATSVIATAAERTQPESD